MTSIRNVAVQAVLTLSLTGLLGAALYLFADYATSGVVV